MKTLGIFVKIVLFVCLSALAWSQALTQIQGTVQDSTGAAVPGAMIKAMQTATGVSRNTTSAADGAYVLPNLPLGPYTLEVTKDGFQKYVQTGITLQVNVAPTVDIALKVGSVSESVQVEASANLVETQTTSVGAVMETQRVLELPLNGRNSADLIQNVGAAVNTGVAGGASSRSMNGGVGYAVAGGQASSVSYQLDGSLHNNPFDNLNLPLPFPDALQEFKVETSSLTAQNGMHSAAAVNAVTKSGTNEIHGDAFEFLRNGAVNGHPYFSTRADNLKRNQYGGTVGGPIQKNKLFAFVGYQGTKTRLFNPDNTTQLPTAKMLAGDFTGCAGTGLRAATGVVDGNHLDTTKFSPAAVKLLGKLNQVGPGPCGVTTFGIATAINEWQLIGRMDYQISDKQTLFGRYMATTFAQTPPYALDQNLLNTIQGGRDNLAQAFTLGDTYLISPTTVNSLRLTVNRTGIQRTNSDFFSAPDLGIPIYSYMPHYMIMSITGGFNLGGGTENAANFRTQTYQLGDDVSLVRGSHQIAFGFTTNQWRSAGYANVRSPGTFTFQGSLTGTGLADFLLGNLSGTAASYLQSAPNTLISQQWYLGAYAQDTWKLTQHLTLNYGVRWEPWFPQQVTNNAVYNFDFGKFTAGQKSTVFKNAPAGFTFPGDAGFEGQAGMNKRWGNFGPRIGLAWDPKGDGRLSIRASYGLSYDFVNGQFFINTSNAPPWGSETRLLGNVPFDNPFAGANASANIFPVSFDVNAPFSLSGPFIALKPNTKNTGVHSWNLTIQKQIGDSWLLSASYLGNETQHLWVSTAGNPGVLTPGATAANLQARRVLSLTGNPDAKYIGFLDFFDDGGTQSYNGMLLSAQKRLSRGVSFQANYTLSHCIGDFTQGGQTPNVGTGFIDPNNRRYDRSPCSGGTAYSFDRRHIFNLTAVVETPKFANKNMRMVASGWKLSGIYSAQSGSPINVTTTNDVLGTGQTAQRPNLVGNPYGTDAFTQYLVPSAFQTPAALAGTFGNLARFGLLGPSYWNLNMAVSRAFRVTERQSVELRGEAFNLSNSLHLGNPTTNVNNATLFGKINSTYSNSNGTGPANGANANDSRVMQFALKYVF